MEQLSQVCRPPCWHTFLTPHTNRTHTLRWSFQVDFSVLWLLIWYGHWSFGRHFCPSFNLLTHLLRCCFNIGHIVFFSCVTSYFMQCTRFSHKHAPSQHDTISFIFHKWDSVFKFGKFPLFTTNTAIVILVKQLSCSFVRSEGIPPAFSTHCRWEDLQTVVLSFL